MEHGGMLVARQLQQEGVRHLFALCGGHISPILVGCRSVGIGVVDVRNEASAVFAADATSRLTGIPGVAAVTAGPGVTNAVTAVKNAQLAHSPLILLGGASATVLRGRGSLQDIDQMAVMRPHVKWAVSVSRTADIPEVLHKAFRLAREGVPGPVFIELPLDLLYPEATVREWYGVKGSEQAAAGLAKRALQLYLDRHVESMFRGVDSAEVIEDSPPGRFSARRLWPTEWRELATQGVDTLQRMVLARRAGALLSRARRPVMLIGSQGVLDPAAIPETCAAIERLGIPVYLSGMARGLLGRCHPQQFRHARKQALREADLVILCGVPCDFRLDYGNHIHRKATLIAINRSPEELFRNRIPTVPVWSDPAEFLQALAGLESACGEPRADWFATLREREQQREAEIEAQARVSGERINPIALLRTVNEIMADDSLIVADGGDFVATAAYTLQPRRPLSWLDPGVFGTLGVGGGFALGATAARPGAECWLIYGDGSCAYSLAEIDTFVRQGRGVIALIGNDGCWNQIARDQVTLLGDDTGVMLRQSHYHQVAVGYGGIGLVLDQPERTREVLEEARRHAAAGRPVVINAVLDRSDFRKGSISV